MNIRSEIKLNDGKSIPILGFGTYLIKPGKNTYEAVRYALDVGYRHIDTASLYANEADVGKAVADSGIPREEIFVTTKVWNSDQGYDNTIRALYSSLKKLKMDYVDLYLIHWPQPGTRKETWRALEDLCYKEINKSIGISNYTIRHTEEFLPKARVKPVINQIEFNPYLYQKELKRYCERRKIAISAYAPLVRAKKFDDERLIKLSEKYEKTPAQILIRWALQIGTIPLPKSVHKERIKENAEVFDFEINDDDMDYLCSFNVNFRVAWDPSKIE